MTYQGYKYAARTDRMGNIIVTHLATLKTCYLQGDDSQPLQTDLDALDSITYPSGPFADYQSHLDVVLDQYSVIME